MRKCGTGYGITSHDPVLPDKIILRRFQTIFIIPPTDKLNLTDLMLASDALITDYTSGYNDYLLLDKPVIFNM